MTTTYAEVLGAHRVAVPEHLEAEAEIPVLTGPQAQGDVIVIPARPSAKRGEPVGPEGVALVRGELGGNTHLLVADGVVRWAPVSPQAGGADLGVVDVEFGTAYLLHPEHGASGIGQGTYIVRRQREQADEARLVAD